MKKTIKIRSSSELINQVELEIERYRKNKKSNNRELNL